MIRRDMPEVLAIESAAVDFPWSEENFLDHLRQRNCIGMVAELGESIVGYMIYELHKHKLYVLNLAVHAEFRRQGVGSQMTDKLYGKLTSHRRRRVAIHLRESNLPAQLFFSSQQYRAVEVVREYFRDTDEAAFLLQREYVEVEEPSYG